MSEITPDQLKQRLGSAAGPRVVDIRPRPEFDAWHIAGAVNVPVYDDVKQGSLAEAMRLFQDLPADRPIVTVCRGGFVSKRAADLLRGLGREAASLAGGMRGWGGVWTEARVPLAAAPRAALIQVRRNGKGCLSYVLMDGGRAAVIDPSVDAAAYLDVIAREGATLAMVLETHVQADHLSRARELAQRTGAELIYPANERVTFPYRATKDGDRLRVGSIEIEVIATPGHTGESVCYLVAGEALLSGDTLFTGAVGRPDLEAGDAGARDGANTLWTSLTQRVLPLPARTRILPAHHGGAIGFDGQPITAALDEVRERLPLLAAERDVFVDTVLRSLQPKPPNFEMVIAVNEGRAGLQGMDPLDIEAGPNRCAVG